MLFRLHGYQPSLLTGGLPTARWLPVAPNRQGEPAEFGQQAGGCAGVDPRGLDLACFGSLGVELCDAQMGKTELFQQQAFDGIGRVTGIAYEVGQILMVPRRVEVVAQAQGAG